MGRWEPNATPCTGVLPYMQWSLSTNSPQLGVSEP